MNNNNNPPCYFSLFDWPGPEPVLHCALQKMAIQLLSINRLVHDELRLENRWEQEFEFHAAHSHIDHCERVRVCLREVVIKAVLPLRPLLDPLSHRPGLGALNILVNVLTACTKTKVVLRATMISSSLYNRSPSEKTHTQKHVLTQVFLLFYICQLKQASDSNCSWGSHPVIPSGSIQRHGLNMLVLTTSLFFLWEPSGSGWINFKPHSISVTADHFHQFIWCGASIKKAKLIYYMGKADGMLVHNTSCS